MGLRTFGPPISKLGQAAIAPTIDGHEHASTDVTAG
jgi:hypothetical protein